MTNEQFESYLDMCYDKLESKQQNSFLDYNIDNFDEYWYDQDQVYYSLKIMVKFHLNLVLFYRFLVWKE